MGKRHNTLNDDIFRNSKYINTIEQELGITDFRKEYKEQYDIMLDVYKTFITINNIIFADSNKSINDKIYELELEFEKIIGEQVEEEYGEKRKHKYSERTRKNLIDSHTRYLFNKFIEWYDYLMDFNKLDLVKREVEEEMQQLENIGFDSVVKGGIEYEKNKDSNYKIFISKFNNLYTDYKAFKSQYKSNFVNTYGIDLTKEEMQYIGFIYDLVAYANNGIIKTLYDKEPIEFDLSEKSSPEEYYKAYLSLLHLDIKDNDLFKKNSEKFLDLIILVSQKLTEQLPKEIAYNIEMTDYINKFDYYYFITTMKDIIDGNIKAIASNMLINKIVIDLKEAYELVVLQTETEELKQANFKKAFDKVQAIIERNKNLYERLS